MAVSQGDSSDFSLHQFMEQDDGREGSSTSDDDTGNAEIAKQHAMAADDHFNSEDTPDTTDSFVQRDSKKKHSKQDPDDMSDQCPLCPRVSELLAPFLGALKLRVHALP